MTRAVRVVRTRLAPARVEAGRAGAPLLYVAPSASPRVVSGALAGRFDLVTTAPPTVIVAGTARMDERTAPRAPARRGRVPWGRWAVARVLAARSRPLPQRELAARAGLTQQAVSLALRQLPVRRVDGGWLGAAELLDMVLAGYPGPGGIAQHWYGLDAPVAAGRAVVACAAERDVPRAISGDVAADEYAPWQQPATAVVYLAELLDLTAVDLVPSTAAEATVVTVVPTDPTVLRTAANSLADPVLTLWDLRHTSIGPDADQAARALRAAIEAGRFDG
ncbi:hypothetical protein [Nocardia sp. NPDC057353]|uniref:hypothetical protein n=1 Tax=Nocardia sp. NPDC057353 TaxID=3346104 RepID=UPI0036399091